MTALTVRVQLVPVGHQSAVVPVVRDTVVVIVMVAGVSLPVVVMVGLVAVGDVRTVVERVLVAVLVDVIVVVAHVPNQVTVRVELQTRTKRCFRSVKSHVHASFSIHSLHRRPRLIATNKLF